MVHVALLLILAGGFLTSRYGVGGAMEIIPGESSNFFTAFDTDVESERSRKVELAVRSRMHRPPAAIDNARRRARCDEHD